MRLLFLLLFLVGSGLVALRLLASAAAAGATPPRIVAAAMIDSDGDRRADRLLLTYSKRVRFAGVASGGGPFSVSGHSIRRVPPVGGSTDLVLQLQEKEQPDPRAAPAVQYTAPDCRSDGVTDLQGRPAPSQAFNGTTPFGDGTPRPPRALRGETQPPLIIAAAMKDGDGDRRADRLVLTYSEPVFFSGGPGAFTVDGYRLQRVPPVRSSERLTLFLAEKREPDVTAAPDVVYDPPDCADDGVRDGAANPAKRQRFTGTEPIQRDDTPNDDDDKDPDATTPPSGTVRVIGKYTGKDPGFKLECSGGFLVADQQRIVGTIRHTGFRTCEVTFRDVPHAKQVSAFITGTWLPRTPVGGCTDSLRKNEAEEYVVPMTKADFGRCLVPF